MIFKRWIGLLLIAGGVLAIAPLPGRAEDVFSDTSTRPSPPVYRSNATHIAGRVLAVMDNHHFTARDDRGQVQPITIARDTIVRPQHLQLEHGMVVSVIGRRIGRSFRAAEVDTPYVLDHGVPFYHNVPWNHYKDDFALGAFFAASRWWYHGDLRNPNAVSTPASASRQLETAPAASAEPALP